MLALINDKVVKNDAQAAMNLLKQFVYVVIEALHKKVMGTLATTDSSTYNNLQMSYQLPSINKLEDLYQTVRTRAEESTRTNDANIIDLAVILSVVSQVRSMMLNASAPVEDEGLQLYTQYQSKMAVAECMPIAKELMRTTVLLTSQDLGTRVKAIEGCWLALQKILTSIVQRVSTGTQASAKLWRWNTQVLEKSAHHLKLKEWEAIKLSIPIHNASTERGRLPAHVSFFLWQDDVFVLNSVIYAKRTPRPLCKTRSLHKIMRIPFLAMDEIV
eukprot:gene10793-12576_t